jgi:hypothetical protein
VAKRKEQQLSSEDFVQRSLVRLGMEIPGLIQMKCHCKTGIIDPEGFHLSSQCPVGNHRQLVHDSLALTLKGILRESGYLVTWEDSSIFREVEDTDKRADIIIHNWEGNRTAILDISVSHPWIAAVQDQSEQNIIPELAAKLREKEKIRKYQALCGNHVEFIPFVMESFGRMGPMARKFLRTCASKRAEDINIEDERLLTFWRQRLSVTLNKYLAFSIKDRSARVISGGRTPAVDLEEPDDYRTFDYVK